MTTLRQGDRGPAVRELQLLLLMTGCDPGPIDGVFGPRTLATWSPVQRELRLVGKPGGMVAGAWGEGEIDDIELQGLRALQRRAVEMPRVLTPIAAVDMRIALVAGYASTFAPCECTHWGDACIPMANAVRVALAHLCVEHGCGPWDGRLWAELDGKGLLPRPWLTPFQAGAPAYIYVWDFNIGNRQVDAYDRERVPVPMAIGLDPGPVAKLRPAVPNGLPTMPWFSMSPVEGSGSSAHRATSAHYAYPNAAEGAAAYWRFLRDHCGPALTAFEAGDPARAAHELKMGAWRYSGDEAAYMRAMADRFNRLAP